MKVFTMEQGTESWYSERAGIMTASESQAIANQGKGLVTYIDTVLQKKYELVADDERQDPNMEAGKEREYQARLLFELHTGLLINEVGFILSDNPYFGCSPDGLIGYPAMAEIKCPNNKTFFRLMRLFANGEDFIDSKYLWQMQGQMLAAKRHWCVFIAYNPNYPTKIIWKWIKEDFGMQRQISEGVELGSKMLVKNESAILSLQQ